jgi:hypothetical protein
MAITYNGMLAAELGDVRWLKSWHSNPNGACVELAALPSGEFAMRNSRFPTVPSCSTLEQRSPHSWPAPRMGNSIICSPKSAS